MAIKIKKTIIFLTVLIGFFLFAKVSYVSANTYYVSKTGVDIGTCTQQASPCLTIRYGISQMTSGDTLLVGDGTYVEQMSGMPNGTAQSYTTIKAVNRNKAIIDGKGLGPWSRAIYLYNKSYVVIDGFQAKADYNATEAGAISLGGNTHHVKILRCSAYNASPSGNTSVIGAGAGTHDNLFEECWAWGTGRYKFIIYQSTNTIVRRSVARHDYHGGLWAKQNSGFTNYDSTNTQFQNNIVIDSGVADGSSGVIYGGIWEENNSGTDKSGKITGSIFLNIKSSLAAISDWKASGNRTISNNVLWDIDGGYATDNQGNVPTAHITVSNLTIGNARGTYPGWNNFWGVGSGSMHQIDVSTTNSIIYGSHDYGIADYMASDYNALYNNRVNYGGDHTPTPGAHDIITTNPLTNGLIYLPRIEAGTVLKTAGQGGGQIGAEIMYQHGVSGTLYGEPGWDTLTSVPLWPFPNEALIKSDFASYNGPGPSGKRGFAADGNGLYGGPITLTSYIWEYLGNPCPVGICTTGVPDTTPPAAPTGVIVS